MKAYDVHELPFVLVDTLAHDVEERVAVDLDPERLLDVGREAVLVRLLDVVELLLELEVVGVGSKALELVEVREPALGSELGGDEVGETWVALEKPTTCGYAICDVRKAVRAHDVDKVVEHLLDQPRVELGHAVHAVGANDGEVRHADLLDVSLLNETHT